jgi:phage-related protein
VRTLIGRAIEIAQWRQTDVHVKRMTGGLREVYEIVIDGDRVTHRALYYPVKRADGPIAILDVFVKKSTQGSTIPAPIAKRIRQRLQRVKEMEREEELS